MLKKPLVFLFIFLVLSALVFSDGHLITGVDGEISSGEYSNNNQLRKADLFWEEEGEHLKIAIRSPTDGWIAVGLGSSKMDGSAMFMGYYKDGESFFEEHLGKGHSHSKVEEARDVSFALQEDDDFTYMEFSVLKSEFLSGGRTSIPVIIAYGNRDNFRAMHRYRDSSEINFMN